MNIPTNTHTDDFFRPMREEDYFCFAGASERARIAYVPEAVIIAEPDERTVHIYPASGFDVVRFQFPTTQDFLPGATSLLAALKTGANMVTL